jgi:hypothetical protein
MKALILSMLVCALIAHPASGQSETVPVYRDYHDILDTVPNAEVHKHIGNFVVVCDEVQWVEKFDGIEFRPTLIKLGTVNPGLTLVIWEDDAAKLYKKPLLEVFTKGRKVCVNGQVTAYQNSPRLEVAFEDQVVFVK